MRRIAFLSLRTTGAWYLVNVHTATAHALSEFPLTIQYAEDWIPIEAVKEALLKIYTYPAYKNYEHSKNIFMVKISTL